MNEKIEIALDRIRHFEPKEGYYLAFSGGKDSIVCKELLNMSEVKYDAHYNVTTVDPPELVRYIKKYHSEVTFETPPITMWKLIPKKKMPPTRLVRYCCDVLKEGGGTGRFVVTGVRWAESFKRKNNRDIVELQSRSKSKETIETKQVFLMSDNDEKRRMIESCTIRGKYVLNPIIDWTDDDVWGFIRDRNLPYCELYDQGFDRLGCVGCPMGGAKQQLQQFERWPQYKKAYLKAFEEMLLSREEAGLTTNWKTPEEVFNWWLKL